MSVLTFDLDIGLTTDRSRVLLGKYSRGCTSHMVTYNPKIEFDSAETKYFNCYDSRVFMFLSDYFGSEPSFDIAVIKKDDSIMEFPKCNVLILECDDIQSVKVTNLSTDVRRAHVLR